MFDCSSHITKYHDDKVSLPKVERDRMRERRNANRERLKKGLQNKGNPTPIGCHSQGSYTMRTMVQDSGNDFDIDDGVYFREEDLVGPKGGELSPLQVRQMVCEALQDENRFARAPEVLKNCVRVYYSEGHHVDVPAYRRLEETSFWTGESEYTYELASAEWKRSDPRQVTNWFNDRNAKLSPDSTSSKGGQFRRVVRLLKKFARSRPSWKSSIATGFMLTKLAEESFVPVLGRDDQAFRETMEKIRSRLTWNTSIEHPVLGGEWLTKDDDARPAFLRKRLAENLKHLAILDQADCTHEQAMKAWDKVFCCDWFVQQQPTESCSGSTYGKPSRAVEKRGGGRYA